MNCVKPMLLLFMATLPVACSPQSQNGSSDAVMHASLPSSPSPATHLHDAQQPAVISDAGTDSPALAMKGEVSMLRSSFEECVKASGGVVPEMQACIESEFEYQEKRMNRAYEHLQKASTASVKAELEFKQKKWLKDSDAKCGWDADEEGQGQRLEANDCFLEMMSVRANELETAVDKL